MRIRRVVVLPDPDGPRMHANSFWATSKRRSRRTSTTAPFAVLYDLDRISTLSCAATPASRCVFKRLHHQNLDEKHDHDEGQRIGQDGRDIEELEKQVDLKAHAVGP